MLHYVEANEGPCSPQTSLAMNGDGSWRIFTAIDELLDDIFARTRAIFEVDIRVVNSCISELCLVVTLGIKSDHHLDLELLEQWDQILRNEVFILWKS